MSNILFFEGDQVGSIPDWAPKYPPINRIKVSTEYFRSYFSSVSLEAGSLVMMKGQAIGVIDRYDILTDQIQIFLATPEDFEATYSDPIVTLKYIGPEIVDPVVSNGDLIDELLDVPDTAFARDI